MKHTIHQVGPFVYLVICEIEEKHKWVWDGLYSTSEDNFILLDEEDSDKVVLDIPLPKLKDDFWSWQILVGARHSFRFLLMPSSYFIFSPNDFPKEK